MRALLTGLRSLPTMRALDRGRLYDIANSETAEALNEQSKKESYHC